MPRKRPNCVLDEAVFLETSYIRKTNLPLSCMKTLLKPVVRATWLSHVRTGRRSVIYVIHVDRALNFLCWAQHTRTIVDCFMVDYSTWNEAIAHGVLQALHVSWRCSHLLFTRTQRQPLHLITSGSKFAAEVKASNAEKLIIQPTV